VVSATITPARPLGASMWPGWVTGSMAAIFSRSRRETMPTTLLVSSTTGMWR
jgi:hypothetical protein